MKFMIDIIDLSLVQWYIIELRIGIEIHQVQQSTAKDHQKIAGDVEKRCNHIYVLKLHHVGRVVPPKKAAEEAERCHRSAWE